MWAELHARKFLSLCVDLAALPSVMGIETHIDVFGTTRPIASMTDADIHIELRRLAGKREFYRQHHIDQLARSTYESALAARAKLEAMDDWDYLVTLPTFVRLSIEMLHRGHELEDLFYPEAT